MIRVLIADSQPAAREQIRVFLASEDDIELVGLARDGQEALEQGHQYRPDVILMSAELAVYDGYQTAEYLKAHGDIKSEIILISNSDSPDELHRVMRAGAREHLVRPLNRDTLLATVHSVYKEHQRRQQAAFKAASDPTRVTRVIAVCGAKGGIGKTTIATNLAVTFAMESGEPTVLFDLYPQFGDVPMLLNMTPHRTLVDLINTNAEEIDGALLDDFCETHESGLRVFHTSRTPVSLDTVPVVLLERVMSLLKQRFRYIVIDIPPVLYTNTLHMISHATSVLIVCNLLDITTVNDSIRLLNTIENKYVAREKVKIVLNRVSRQNQLDIPDVERTLKHTIAVQIPNDAKTVHASINQGMPFVISHPDSPVSKSVRQLAASLTATGSFNASPLARPRREGLSFLRGWRRSKEATL